MKNSPLSICNEFIQAGEKVNLALQMPDLYSFAPSYMPLKVIHGKNPGPCLLIFSTINGNEMNGLEIVNRLIHSIQPDEIHGTIIAIPVLNVYGLTHYPKTTPSGQPLAECFPGKSDGKYGERIAYLFTQELVQKADYCIELLTGSPNHAILPQVYCNFQNEISKKLAKSFQVPVVTNISLAKNKLRQTIETFSIPLIIYQAGEAMRFDETAIQLGTEGTKNFMRTINMLPHEIPAQSINPVFSQDEEWLTANKGGILHTHILLGQTVRKGDKLGTISDPFSSDVEELVTAPQNGIIVGINAAPLVHEGLSIFKIASFIDNHKAESVIEKWEEQKHEFA